jgi:murein DD-endopeptidase MepM/ murein hydrolase activator NlpD
MKKHKALLIVPPFSKRVRFVRIRFFVVVMVFIFLLAGLAGYFIPFNNFTLDVVEQNQQKNLTEQNHKLFQKISTMRKLLHNLTGSIDRLSKEKESIEKIAGVLPGRDSGHTDAADQMPDMTLDQMYEYVNAAEKFYAGLALKAQTNASVFCGIPLSRPVGPEGMPTFLFGEERDPFTGALKRHLGLDYAAPRETPVVATASGTVLAVEDHKRWGKRIRILHAHGFSTVYAHLGTVKVHSGQAVKRGETIATVGISGLATGPHLHYEIWQNGKAVDPELYIFPQTDPLNAMFNDPQVYDSSADPNSAQHS